MAGVLVLPLFLAACAWNIEWESGHGGCSSDAAYVKETALLYGLLLPQLGHPDFQPGA